jgi:copper homeostasis protein
MGVLFESCVDSLDAALASVAGGARRLELCAHLEVGGTTPEPALVRAVVAAVPVPVFAMVRPRGGGFVYGDAEVETMVRDIRAMRAAGAHGLVFGALRSDRTLDDVVMRRLLSHARPLPVTCHKAFDDTADLTAALGTLVTLGVDRVLTAGGRPTAAEGTAMIAALVARAGDTITVVAGGRVRAAGVAALVRETGVSEVHARVIREPGPADDVTRERWRLDVAAVVAAANL